MKDIKLLDEGFWHIFTKRRHCQFYLTYLILELYVPYLIIRSNRYDSNLKIDLKKMKITNILLSFTCHEFEELLIETVPLRMPRL